LADIRSHLADGLERQRTHFVPEDPPEQR